MVLFFVLGSGFWVVNMPHNLSFWISKSKKGVSVRGDRNLKSVVAGAGFPVKGFFWFKSHIVDGFCFLS